MCCAFFMCREITSGSNKAGYPPLRTPCAPVPRSHCTLASKCKHSRFAVLEYFAYLHSYNVCFRNIVCPPLFFREDYSYAKNCARFASGVAAASYSESSSVASACAYLAERSDATCSRQAHAVIS